MAVEFEGKIDAEGKFELTRSFWKTLKGTFALPQVSRRLTQAAQKKKVLDWYDIRDYSLDTARDDEFITGFPSRGGDCILILSITAGASTQIKFDNVNSDSFELANYRKLRHNFSNFYLTNTAQAGSTLKILFGRGDWEVVRHYPEEEIVAINADTVDGLHASASIEPGSLLALGADGFFPCGAVRCLQNELFANLPAAPVVGDVFISSDTGELYICFTAGVWTNILTPTAAQIAFVPAGDIVATDVQAAIQELDTEKLADVANVINDTHIDWGLGANEVSAADMPIADPGAIIVATQVEGALQEIMTDLNGFPDRLKFLTAAEIQQLENIGPTTISADQFGFLGAIDAYSDYMNQQFNNLLKNGSFESWSAGAAALPDEWVQINVGTYAREAGTVKIGTYSFKITRGAAGCNVVQNFHIQNGIAYWQNRTVTCGCWVWSDDENSKINILDSIGSTTTAHSGSSAWEFLTVTRTIDAAAAFARVQLTVYPGIAGDIGYFDGAILVEGTICPTFAPAPAEHVVEWQAWIPTLTGNADLSAYNTARFCRIGKVCFFTFNAHARNVTTAGAYVEISLPYTSGASSGSQVPSSTVHDGAAWVGQTHLEIPQNTNSLRIYKTVAAGGWAGTEVGVYIRVSGSYEVA